MMKSITLFSTLALSIIPFVAGHGYVRHITIDGKTYEGPAPRAGSKAKENNIIRPVTGVDPSHGATNKNLACGPGSKPASSSAPANPGSIVEWNWQEYDDGRKWPHNAGSIITYMASCGDVDCSKFDASNAKWFKIDEAGKKNGVWAQASLYAGKKATSTIPATLAPGNYLMMQQLISLHLAVDNPSGAEFYASCAQVEVGGNQKGAPSANELVSMPGGYVGTKGLTQNNYSNPGPPIAKLAATASPSTPETNESASPSEPAATESSSPTESGDAPAPTKSSGSCKNKSGKKQPEASIHYKPRHISRVMHAVARDMAASLH